MENKKITAKTLTRTAILLAVAVIAQQLRLLIPSLSLVNFGPLNLSNLIIGSLVNLCLILAAEYTGFFGGLSLALITPIISFMQGQLPIVQMIFAVAAGNSTIVIVYLLLKKRGRIFAMLTAAVAKFGVLYAAVLWGVIPFFVVNMQPAEKAGKLTATLSAGFSLPQLATAVLGAVLAYLIIERLPKENS